MCTKRYTIVLIFVCCIVTCHALSSSVNGRWRIVRLGKKDAKIRRPAVNDFKKRFESIYDEIEKDLKDVKLAVKKNFQDEYDELDES